MAEEQQDVLVLLDDAGEEHKFIIIDMLEIDEERYAILMPDREMGEEAVILKVGEDEEGEFLFPIEDDDEWEMVAQAWQETVSEEMQ